MYIIRIQQGGWTMLKFQTVILLFAVTLIAQPCLALSGVPDLYTSEAFTAFEGPGLASLLVVPDGSGNRFTEAHDEQGNVVDATITLFLRDGAAVPIANYPFEDLWLESIDGGLVFCIGGTTADANTDAQGVTQWVDPLFAGGFSHGPVLVIISGSALGSNPGLPLRFNSPDVNGDLRVNLQDISILAVDFFTNYNFRCDLNGDSYLNLQDLSIFAEHFGVQCP